MNDSLKAIPSIDQLPTLTIRELVEAYPDVLPALAPYGIDLCCGGSHALGEALDLHGIDRESALRSIHAALSARQESR